MAGNLEVVWIIIKER